MRSTERLMWDVRLPEEHGVEQYPFGRDSLLDLCCARRKSAAEKPVIHATTNTPVKLEVRWSRGAETLRLRP